MLERYNYLCVISLSSMAKMKYPVQGPGLDMEKMPFLTRIELKVKRTLEAAWEVKALFSDEGRDRRLK